MEFNVNEKVLVINTCNRNGSLYKAMKISWVKQITSTGIIKLTNGLRFTEDGFPYGYKSYQKKCFVDRLEPLYFGWRLFKIDEALADSLINYCDEAVNMKKEK